jgi:hypothetical protein
MKKFLLLVIISAAAYFAYEYLIKEKEVLEIKADKVVSTSYSMDIEAPALSPSNYATVQGTVKNISGKVVSNLLLRYKLDGKTVDAVIGHLEPGEQRNFSTQGVMVRGAGVPFYLEETRYD